MLKTDFPVRAAMAASAILATKIVTYGEQWKRASFFKSVSHETQENLAPILIPCYISGTTETKRSKKPEFGDGASSALYSRGKQHMRAARSRGNLPGDDAKRFIGTWRLVSIAGASVVSMANRGQNPVGIMHYDGNGHMAVQIMPGRSRRKYADALPTPEEARDALLGYTAYFGTYTVDEKNRTVTHHREGNINPGGLGDYVRRYEFLTDDRLILRPVESTSELTWERIK